MAHFARLQKQPNPFTAELEWTVHECIVISNDVPTAAGPLGDNDMHVDGETWCENFWGGAWKQTSYNDNFRKQFAGIGGTYDAAKDKFIAKQPFSSWSLDGNDDWQPPIANPTTEDDFYEWNETAYQADNSTGWILVTE